VAHHNKGSPTLSPVLAVSSALTFASDTAVVSQYTPTGYERTTYYNGITGDDHPELVYRSDFLTTPFPKPVGRYAHIPVKSLHGVYDTPLNGIWETVGPKIVDLITTRKINWSSVDPLLASSPTQRRERRRRGVSVLSSYGSALALVLPPPMPPTRSPKRSLRFSGSMKSKMLS
jgi:hypothetical protein